MSAVAGGVLGLANTWLQTSAADRASERASDAANNANRMQWDMYQQNRTDTAPWRTAGGAAVTQLSGHLGPNGDWTKNFGAADFQADPGYQFRLEQGAKALERAGAARGSQLSGAQLKGLTDYNSGMASQEYGNAYNRFMNNRSSQYNMLSNLAGLGQTSTGQVGQLGAGVANNMGNNLMDAATVAGNAGMANAVAWGSALNNLGNQWQQYQYMNNMGGMGGMNAANPWSNMSGNVGMTDNGGWAAATGTGEAGTDGWGF